MVLIAGCFQAKQTPLAAAASAGHLLAPQAKVTWRRKPLSLRTLGRVMQASSKAVNGRQLPVSRAVVNWAAAAVLPNGVDESTNFDRLGNILFRRVSGVDQSPKGLVTSSR